MHSLSQARASVRLARGRSKRAVCDRGWTILWLQGCRREVGVAYSGAPLRRCGAAVEQRGAVHLQSRGWLESKTAWDRLQPVGWGGARHEGCRSGPRGPPDLNASRTCLSRLFSTLRSQLLARGPRPATTAQDRPLRNAFSQFPQSPEWNMPLRTVGKTQIDQELPVIFASQQITMTH